MIDPSTKDKYTVLTIQTERNKQLFSLNSLNRTLNGTYSCILNHKPVCPICYMP